MPGRAITYERVKDWWAKDLPVAKGQWNFDEIRFIYFRDRVPAFEAFKAGQLDFWRENSAKSWATAFDFDAVKRGLVKMERLPIDTVALMQSLCLQHAAPAIPGPARAARLQPGVRLRVGQQEPVLRPVRARRQLLRQLGAEGDRPAARARARDPERGEGPGAARGFHHRMEEPRQRHAARTRASTWRGGQAAGRGRLAAQGRRARPTPRARSSPPNSCSCSPTSSASCCLTRRRWRSSASRPACASSTPRSTSAATIPSTSTSSSRASRSRCRPATSSATSGARRRPARKAAAMSSASRIPAVDKLIDRIILAKDRDDLVAATRALDRVLLWNHYVVPQWHTPVRPPGACGTCSAARTSCPRATARSCGYGGTTRRRPSGSPMRGARPLRPET